MPNDALTRTGGLEVYKDFQLPPADWIRPRYKSHPTPPQISASASFAQHVAGKAPKLTVKVVDAAKLRSQSLDFQEFGSVATHTQFHKIPPNEIWIADTVPEEERPLLIEGAEAEVVAHKQGQNESDAYEYGLAVERAERERDVAIGGNRPLHDEVMPEIYVEHWQDIAPFTNTLKVWIVSGIMVRNTLKTDWVEGGNAYVYPFMPEDEIWIEDQVKMEERDYVLVHEATERSLMKHEDLDYDQAHAFASNVEFKCRQDELHGDAVFAVAKQMLANRKAEGIKALDLPQADWIRSGTVDSKSRKPHKFGCLMLLPDEALRKEITDWTTENVLECHWGPGGMDYTPHITSLYGFTDSSEAIIQTIRSLLARTGPITAHLAKISLFTEGYGKWINEDGDVLKIDIESPQLHELNALLRGSFEHENKYKEYVPHLTLCYLLPEISRFYDNNPAPFLGRTITLTEAEFSGADGTRTRFPLSFLSQLRMDIKGMEEGKPCTPGHTAERDQCIPQQGPTPPQVSKTKETSSGASPLPLSHVTPLPEGGKAWAKKLTEDERLAIEDWIDYQKVIRDHFEAGTLDDNDRAFLTALEKAPIVKGQVYRGLSLDKDKLDSFLAMEPEDTWTDKTPFSMARSSNLASSFAVSALDEFIGKKGALLVIQSKTGRSIAGVFDEQKEVVALPGTTYQVTKVGEHTKFKGYLIPVVHISEIKREDVGQKSLVWVDIKALSWLNINTGGALVPPPKQGDKNFDTGARIDTNQLTKIGQWLAEHTNPAPMPGYGQIFVNQGAQEVWYVGGDGDEDGFEKLAKERLGKVAGVGKVTVEAEGFPKRGEAWLQVYPKAKQWKSLDYQIKSRGLPCKRGERASVTGCIPRQRGPVPPKVQSTNPVAVASEEPPQGFHEVANKPKVKKSKAPVWFQSADKQERKATMVAVADLFGDDFGLDDLATVVGAPDDAEVYVEPISNGLKVTVLHSDFANVNYKIKKDSDNDVYLYINEFFLSDQTKGRGLGSDVFANTVQGAKEFGVSYINLWAAGSASGDMNGYYTWPRFGFNQSIYDIAHVRERDPGAYDPGAEDLVDKIYKDFPDASSVLDIMITKKGRDWWKENGRNLFDAKFDLSDNSRSMQVFNTYMEERTKASKTKALHKETDDEQQSKQPVMPLTQWEEEALERAWQRIEHQGWQEQSKEPPIDKQTKSLLIDPKGIKKLRAKYKNLNPRREFTSNKEQDYYERGRQIAKRGETIDDYYNRIGRNFAFIPPREHELVKQGFYDEKAFSGKRRDALGRQRCYSNGVLVPCPDAGSLLAANEQNTAHRIDQWLVAARRLPSKVLNIAKRRVQDKYNKLEARYGRRYALAIIAAGVASLPVPAPGASLVAMAPLVGLAELHRRLSGTYRGDRGSIG